MAHICKVPTCWEMGTGGRSSPDHILTQRARGAEGEALMQVLLVGLGAGPAGLRSMAVSTGEDGLASDLPRAAGLSQERWQEYLRRTGLRTRVGGRSRKTQERSQLLGPCR